MLILTLKETGKILIGDKITVMVVEIRGNQIRLGIEAPAGFFGSAGKAGGGKQGHEGAQEMHNRQRAP